MADIVTLPLAKPITAHGETLSALELRPPTVKELRACGSPKRVGAGGIVVEYEACAQLLSRICAIPPSSIDQMDPGDFDEACWRLVGFMTPSSAGETADPAPATTSAG